jgi:hypothetical protein
MKNQAPKTKEHLALLRFEVICHIKTLRQEAIPLAECLRAASSRPWPGEDGVYYSYRTMETWWYGHARHGFTGLAGKAKRADAGKSRMIDTETGLWIIEAITKTPGTPLSVLYRHWQNHGRGLPSLSTVLRFLAAHGYDRRSLKAGRLESGPTKAFEAPAPNDLWMVDFACGPTLRGAEGRAITTQLCVILDDHSRLIVFAAYYLNGDTASFLDCLKQAVLRRGLPIKLYTDQGKPFVNTHVRLIRNAPAFLTLKGCLSAVCLGPPQGPRLCAPTSASGFCTPSPTTPGAKVKSNASSARSRATSKPRCDSKAAMFTVWPNSTLRSRDGSRAPTTCEFTAPRT